MHNVPNHYFNQCINTNKCQLAAGWPVGKLCFILWMAVTASLNYANLIKQTLSWPEGVCICMRWKQEKERWARGHCGPWGCVALWSGPLLFPSQPEWGVTETGWRWWGEEVGVGWGGVFIKSTCLPPPSKVQRSGGSLQWRTEKNEHLPSQQLMNFTHSGHTGCTGSPRWRGPRCSWWRCRWVGSMTGRKPGCPHSWWCQSAGCSWLRWGWSSPGCCAAGKWKSRAGAERVRRWDYSGCSSPEGKRKRKGLESWKIELRDNTPLLSGIIALHLFKFEK